MNSLSRKIISLCAATTLACAGAGFAAPAAFAAPGFQQQDDSANLPADRLLDPNQAVTLKVHKYEGEIEDLPIKRATGLEGVGFTVERVLDENGQKFDLTKNESWKRFNALIEKDNINDLIPTLGVDSAGGNASDATKVGTTDGNGLATFTFDQGAGIYRVTESSPKDGYSVTAPFLVALPDMADNGNWVYEKDVYPKNQKIQPTKEVDDSEATLGKDLWYKLSSRVPSSNLATFVITDHLVDNLQYVDDSLKVTVVSPRAYLNSVAAPELERATDAANPNDYTVALPTAPGGDVVITFTEAGKTKLEKFYKDQGFTDARVEVEFKAKVMSLPDNGVITNSADFNINGKHYSTDKPNEDPNQPAIPASTTFANLTITKTSPGVTDAEELKDAEFELYRCEQKNGAWELKGAALSTGVQNTGVDNQQKLVTAVDNGAAVAKGFGIPVKSNSTSTAGERASKFCIIETKAPSGFVRNPEIIPVQETPATSTEAAKLVASVENQKTTFLNQLPSTGAWGIVLVFLLGFLLLARGLYTTRRDGQATA